MKKGGTVVDDERWIVVVHGQGQCVVGDLQGATHMHACSTNTPLLIDCVVICEWNALTFIHNHHTESLVVRHETTHEGAHMDRC